MTSQVRTIDVEVKAATANKEYEHPYTPETQAGQVLADAMAYFKVASDGTTRYYLLLEGTEVATSATLASLEPDDHHGHGHKGKLAFRMRTELISGGR